MAHLKDIIVSTFWLILPLMCEISTAADVLVQLNVNRPLTDVNEKFVSFAVRPEDLYKALDGENRKVLTRMATLLGDSYIRFIGDYTFAAESKLRNPTKIIWKGFNRWTRAVNWTMIIPVPYEPKTWDPVVTLRILNSSYQLGITDCIWQLGTDFGTSNARDYVAEMKTFHLMVETFKPYVDDWTVMGADISAGSSAEETRRYIEASKNLNRAFGWTYSSDMISSDSMGDYLNMNDASLRMLLSKDVPVWLSMPSLSKTKRFKQHLGKRTNIDEATDALRWAQTLGEAATSGIDTIFKRLSISELENPSFSFYVTALFKKVMGSRVFQARPLHIFSRNNKLYTHCANAISGGISFMLVNTEDTAKDIVLRSLTKMSASDVWQYSLTEKKGTIYLNNEKITVNSTLKPNIKKRNADKSLILSAPAKSVTFWVLPNVDIEHCQYTEIEASELESSASSEKVTEKPNYSSSDRLIRQLIQDTALPHSALVKFINRRRRYATFSNSRQKRFVLEDKNEQPNGFADLLDSFGGDQKSVKKREHEIIEPTALDWLNNWLSSLTQPRRRPLLKREARSADDLFGPIFDENRPKAITKKITEIRKPEKKGRPLFNREQFDEEEFFKKVGDQSEPDYMRLPDGDVHLKHIETPEGEEVEEEKNAVAIVDTPKRRQRNMKPVSKEVQNESKPMRLLPTELYEALPGFKAGATKMNIGNALNSLLFAEPFSKKPSKMNNKNKDLKSESPSENTSSDKQDKTILLNDFLRAQKELSKTILSESDMEREEVATTTERTRTTEPSTSDSDETDTNVSKQEAKLRLLDMLTENLEHYFSEREEKKKAKKEKIDSKDISKKELKDFSWWNFGTPHKKRKARALAMHIPDEAWQHNIIPKDDDSKPFNMPILLDNMKMYEYHTVKPQNMPTTTDGGNDSENDSKFNRNEKVKTPTDNNTSNETTTSFEFVSTVKRNVSNIVNMVAHHVQKLYNTLTKHIELESSSSSNTVIISPK